jgi:hypothetical protein
VRAKRKPHKVSSDYTIQLTHACVHRVSSATYLGVLVRTRDTTPATHETTDMRRFCWYAAVCIAADWVLQINFFVACFVLTERRIISGRFDWLCCFRRRPSDTIAAAKVFRPTDTSARGSSAPDRDVHTALTTCDCAEVTVVASRSMALPQGHRCRKCHGLCCGSNGSVPSLRCHAALYARETPTAMTSSGDDSNSVDIVQGTAADTAQAEPTRSPPTPSDNKLTVGFLSSSKDSWLQIFLNRVLVPLLLYPVGQVAILSLLVAGLVSGGVGISRLGEGLKLPSLAPDNHYVKSFYTLNDKFSSGSGAPQPAPPARSWLRFGQSTRSE